MSLSEGVSHIHARIKVVLSHYQHIYNGPQSILTCRNGDCLKFENNT